jgi:hypothetical protein
VQGYALHSPPPDLFLKNIPLEDRQKLTLLFKSLMLDDYLAYTLFGSKPMTHKAAFFEQSYKSICKPTSTNLFLKYWPLWKKYSNNLQMPNYAFIEKKYPELFEIHFVNKSNVLQCVKNHLRTFKKILGDSITPQEVLNSILNGEDVYESLGNSQVLYGILFGFGEESSQLFYEKYELGRMLPDSISFNTEPPDSPHLLPLPNFAIFYHSLEIDEIRRAFEKERSEIIKIYSQGDFLEITLSQLLK